MIASRGALHEAWHIVGGLVLTTQEPELWGRHTPEEVQALTRSGFVRWTVPSHLGQDAGRRWLMGSAVIRLLGYMGEGVEHAPLQPWPPTFETARTGCRGPEGEGLSWVVDWAEIKSQEWDLIVALAWIIVGDPENERLAHTLGSVLDGFHALQGPALERVLRLGDATPDNNTTPAPPEEKTT